MRDCLPLTKEQQNRKSILPIYYGPPELYDFMVKIASTQEPLGSEFEQVLHDNLWDLYDS